VAFVIGVRMIDEVCGIHYTTLCMYNEIEYKILPIQELSKA
jgi:hypothetical protein